MVTLFVLVTVGVFGFMVVKDMIEDAEDDERDRQRLLDEGLLKEQRFDDATTFDDKPRRATAVRGVFSQHNQQFKCCGIKKPTDGGNC